MIFVVDLWHYVPVFLGKQNIPSRLPCIGHDKLKPRI